MDGWEAKRRENVKRNAALVQSLGLDNHNLERAEPQRPKAAPAKRRKLETGQPTRSSARIAQVAEKPATYSEDALGGASLDDDAGGGRKGRGRGTKARGRPPKPTGPAPAPSGAAHPDLESIRSGWTSWEAVAPAPMRDASGVYHFESHPEFQPNKSPEEIMREGCFGGSYWRPLYSRYLKTTVEDDWRELPAEWTEGLDVERCLTSPEYDAEVNKYGVACGQSIEEWEVRKHSLDFLSSKPWPFTTSYIPVDRLLTRGRLLAGLLMTTTCVAGSSGTVASGWAVAVTTTNDRCRGGRNAWARQGGGVGRS